MKHDYSESFSPLPSVILISKNWSDVDPNNNLIKRKVSYMMKIASNQQRSAPLKDHIYI